MLVAGPRADHVNDAIALVIWPDLLDKPIEIQYYTD
jgi:hypothetical protein